jgi:hydrogenase expression/formation protein HypE
MTQTITMAHGSGGASTGSLIRDVFLKHFGNEISLSLSDAAVLPELGHAAFTTDSYVVEPLFFPGGDIGRLAVAGTVNDLLTSGARPRYLSAGFILEEGLSIQTLEAVCRSMAQTAAEAGVQIVTGDTKVIEAQGAAAAAEPRKAPALFINTAGVGSLTGAPIDFRSAQPGDRILVSGTLGDHHACILASRLGIETEAVSDAAPLTQMLSALREAGITLHGMRDITRGGLATVLAEISAATGIGVEVEEARLPVSPAVDSLARALGLDPLYMGNEGKAVFFVPEEEAEAALAIIKKSAYGHHAAGIGSVTNAGKPTLITKLGGTRLLAPLRGEGLPRIC